MKRFQEETGSNSNSNSPLAKNTKVSVEDPKPGCSKDADAVNDSTENNKYTTYFEIKEDNGIKHGICRLCKNNGKQKTIKMKQSNTFGLRRHLQSVHGYLGNSIILGKKKQNVPVRNAIQEMFQNYDANENTVSFLVYIEFI